MRLNEVYGYHIYPLWAGGINSDDQELWVPAILLDEQSTGPIHLFEECSNGEIWFFKDAADIPMGNREFP